MVGFGDFLEFCFYILFIFFTGKAVGVIDTDKTLILCFDLLRRGVCRYLKNSSIIFHSRLLEDADRMSGYGIGVLGLPANNNYCLFTLLLFIGILSVILRAFPDLLIFKVFLLQR